MDRPCLEALFGDGDEVEDEAVVRRRMRAQQRANNPDSVTCARQAHRLYHPRHRNHAPQTRQFEKKEKEKEKEKENNTRIDPCLTHLRRVKTCAFVNE